MVSQLKFFQKGSTGFLFAVIILSIFQLSSIFASVSFNPPNNASNTGQAIAGFDLDSSGSTAHVVWLDFDPINGLANVFYTNSIDYAANKVQVTSTGTVGIPQVAAIGSDGHVVWDDSSEVYYNNTSNFPNPGIQLSDGSALSSSPQIDTDGTDAYVVWNQNAEILYANSTDNFIQKTTVSDGSGSSFSQHIAVSGTNVHFSWADGSGIKYRNAVGNSLGTTEYTVSSSGSQEQIAAAGSEAIFVWQEFDGTQNVIKSRMFDGSSLSSPLTISNPIRTANLPQIVANGTHAFAVWEEYDLATNNEVFYAIAPLSTGIFSAPINLSDEVNFSTNPEITVSDSGVYVTWCNDFSPPLDLVCDEIFMRSSSDGTNFGSFIDVSNTLNISSSPKISASPTDVFIGWQEDGGAFNPDVFVASSSSINDDVVTFDNTSYVPTDSPILTIKIPTKVGVDPPDEVISANIKSTTDTLNGFSGINVDLTASGNNGVFSGTFDLDIGVSDDPSDTLQVTNGDIITATYVSDSGSALISPIGISLKELGAPTTTFDWSSIGEIVVTDATKADSITVHASTNNNPT